MTRTDDVGIDITLPNLEGLASEGSFPACQKNKGTKEKDYIPFCVDGVCEKNTYENKGKLDVNYCTD